MGTESCDLKLHHVISSCLGFAVPRGCRKVLLSRIFNRMAVRQRGKTRSERAKGRESQNSHKEKSGNVISTLEKFKSQRTAWIVAIGEMFTLF